MNDDVLPDNSRIRGGTFVAFVPYMMGRLDVIWGADCLKFKPERHLKDGKYVKASLPYFLESQRPVIVWVEHSSKSRYNMRHPYELRGR